jgi:uncharacterized membrane protein
VPGDARRVAERAMKNTAAIAAAAGAALVSVATLFMHGTQ